MFQKYLYPMTDFGFKKLFGEEESKPILKHFLFSILDLPSPITSLDLLPREQLPDSPEERRGVFDIYYQDENGQRFLVEMQKIRQIYFKDRVLYYSTFPIQKQAEVGEAWNFQLNTVYCIGLLDFSYYDDDRFFRRIQLMDCETNELFSEKLCFVYIEFPKFNLDLSQLESDREKWIYFISHAGQLYDLPDVFAEEPFASAFRLAELGQLREAERYYYEGSLKLYRDRYAEQQTAREEGLEEGLEEGRKEKAIEIAKALIQQGIPTETILQATQLTPEELSAISTDREE